jgi:hypothetical protein
LLKAISKIVIRQKCLGFPLPLCAFAEYFLISRKGAKRQSKAQSIFEIALSI